MGTESTELQVSPRRVLGAQKRDPKLGWKSPSAEASQDGSLLLSWPGGEELWTYGLYGVKSLGPGLGQQCRFSPGKGPVRSLYSQGTEDALGSSGGLCESCIGRGKKHTHRSSCTHL